MEQRKGGYCNISKLRFETTDEITPKKVENEIIEPSEIRDEMRKCYQQIINKQTVREVTEAIDEFLSSEADTNPCEELDKRKLNDETRDSLEGNISLHEMTKSQIQ